MSYLTYNEYIELGFQKLDKELFAKLLRRASPVLDTVTLSFYQFNDFESDLPFRRNKFQLALGAQIEFFYETGFVTTEGLNSQPQNVSLGRTKISMSSRANQQGEVEQKSIVCEEVYMHLSQTGLLNRGVM